MCADLNGRLKEIIISVKYIQFILTNSQQISHTQILSSEIKSVLCERQQTDQVGSEREMPTSLASFLV